MLKMKPLTHAKIAAKNNIPQIPFFKKIEASLYIKHIKLEYQMCEAYSNIIQIE